MPNLAMLTRAPGRLNMPAMNLAQRLFWTAKGVGWDNLPRRLLQAARVRSGWLAWRLAPRRFSEAAFERSCRTATPPRRLWEDRRACFLPIPTAEALARVADPDDWAKSVTAVVERALAGDYPFFNHWTGRLGWPPNFNRDPVHGLDWPVGRHWLHTVRSGPPTADIKLVWEPSRLALAYHLARAYAKSRDDRWAEAFWRMFDAWVGQNPPMLAVAWGCGQETAFRLMAMLTAALATLPSPSATEQRLRALSLLAWRSGRAIETNINYARSQCNNHGISEAVGLWTLGLLFGEFAEAGRWRAKGRGILARECRRQIADDGSHLQHSLNYHRVVMDDLLWAVRLGELNGQPLDPIVYDRLGRAADWMVQLIDPVSGRAPNYGPNDGALVLPLSVCDYLDYRPTAQAAGYLAGRARWFEPGPWDETMLWLFGPESLDAPVRRPTRANSFAAEDGGYYVLRGPRSWAMIRCHTYRRRPTQADMLHLDLWWDGLNVLADGGSYSYRAAEPWQSFFYSTAAHNTVQIDGRDQMVKGPRFLWFQWTRSRRLRFEDAPDGRTGRFEGEHYGYRRLNGRVVHRRAVWRDGDVYVVIDDLIGRGRGRLALRWRLCDGDWQGEPDRWRCRLPGGPASISLVGPHQARLLSGVEGDCPVGWASLYYGEKLAVPTLAAEGETDLPARFVTAIALGDEATLRLDGDVVQVVAGERTVRLTLAPPGGETIIRSAGGD